MLRKLLLHGAIMSMLFILIIVDYGYSDPQGSRILFPNVIVTTSERSNVRSGYPLFQMIDEDPKTAWVFNPDPLAGEMNEPVQFEIQCLDDSKIKTIRIINGYSKSKELYIKNNRITQITIEDKQNNGYDYDLEETLLFQDIQLPAPLDYLRLTAKKIVRGSKYDDTCISEMVLLNESGEDILKGKEYFIFSSSGEYPKHVLFDKDMNIILAPESDGIVEIGFSPEEDKVYFINSEIDGIGFDVLDLKSRLMRNYLKGYVLQLEWVTNVKVRVRYYDFNDHEEEMVIDISP
jgi:hypothetical protein